MRKRRTRRKEPSEFEKVVNLGISRAFHDEKVKDICNRIERKQLWTDPHPEVSAARRALAEFIVRDLQGSEDEPKAWKEKWFKVFISETTAVSLNVNESFHDPQRREWEDYRQKYGMTVSVEDVERAFPFRYIREKRESGHRTNIERLVENELKRRGEDYRFEAVLDFYNVDFFLPQRNLVIECDQEYWHGSPEAMNRDIKKTVYLREKGYRVARLLFGREATDETVKHELDELLERKRASLQTVLTPPWRTALEQSVQELRQRYGRALSKAEDHPAAQFIENWQRLLDEDAGKAVADRLAVRSSPESDREGGSRAQESDLYADIEMAGETISEARSAIKNLRFRNKQLRQQKKVINLGMKEIRAKYRDKLSGRTGRGFFGAVLRASKATARANRDKELEPLETEKLKIHNFISKIDYAILKLQEFMKERKLEA